MSVTFWMPQAPVERIQPYKDEPEYWEIVPALPFTEINLANSNARDLLRVLMPEKAYPDLCGEWAQEDLVRVRRNAIEALNSRRVRSGLETKSFSEVGDRGCVVYTCGRDADYVTGRLESFLELTRVAMEHEFPVCFG